MHGILKVCNVKYKANKQTKSVNKTNSNKNKHIGMQNRAVVIRREATGKRAPQDEAGFMRKFETSHVGGAKC